MLLSPVHVSLSTIVLFNTQFLKVNSQHISEGGEPIILHQCFKYFLPLHFIFEMRETYKVSFAFHNVPHRTFFAKQHLLPIQTKHISTIIILMHSGIFHCLHLACRIQNSMTPSMTSSQMAPRQRKFPRMCLWKFPQPNQANDLVAAIMWSTPQCISRTSPGTCTCVKNILGSCKK